MGEGDQPRLFSNRWADAVAPGGREPDRDRCHCIGQYGESDQTQVGFHPERQDTSAPGWLHLLDLIEEAAADGREVFKPLVELSPSERREIVTLPPTIAKLTTLKHFVLYGSNLVRIPPQIGAMTSLEEFSPYTSHRLHWFPYEITRCAKLRHSTVSTRALYGNFKHRPPFPPLRQTGPWSTETTNHCSVCESPLEADQIHQVWISLAVATDVLPLLVNACSPQCIDALPTPAKGCVSTPHHGGPNVTQPRTRY